MRTLFCFLLLSLSAHTCPAQTLRGQLLSINQNWQQFTFPGENQPAIPFGNDRELIRFHLAQAEAVLRNADLSPFSDEQRAARSRNLDLLHGYITAGVFPVNLHCSYRTPVFIDGYGTHCAVGFLIQQSGNEALAQRIATRNNYVHVKDIAEPEMKAWQWSSGFSLEELALIQPAYMLPPTAFEQPYACTTAYFENVAYVIVPPSNADAERSVWYSGECKNGKLDGKWVQYASPGALWISGNFRNGKKDGEWVKYFTNSKNERVPELVEMWSNGLRNGRSVTYDYAGNKSAEGNYVNGAKDGLWQHWSQGMLMHTEQYTAGKKDGRSVYYYVKPGNQSQPEMAQEDEYTDGVLQRRTKYTQGSVLESTTVHEGSQLYATVHYYSNGKVASRGKEWITVKVDSAGNEMYPNATRTYYEYEAHVKVGRWTYCFNGYNSHPLAHRTPIDSIHLCFEARTDSVRSAVSFGKEGAVVCRDSTVFTYLQASDYPVYGGNYLHRASETWTTHDNVICSHTAKWPNGTQQFACYYFKGELTSMHYFYPSGVSHRSWNVSTENGARVMTYYEYDTQHRLTVKGYTSDTATRTGKWEHYDSTGVVIGGGNYVNNRKDGMWMETYADGTRWQGTYVNGKKKGVWEMVFPREEKVRREKF